MLEHGGGIRQAAARFGLPPAQWLDLSTGINPLGWTPLAIPSWCWSRLPEEADGLEAAAHAYYQSTLLLPVAGSQAAIQLLPRLRPPGRVAVLTPTYSEHAQAWEMNGHQVVGMTPAALEIAVESFEVVVVVNPNNPTGTLLKSEKLLSWYNRLQQRGGWLVVDEAFMDATPAHTLVPHLGLPGLIVLRSIGKFFGLAGARLGFVLAEWALLQQLRQLLGPWSLAGPSRWLASHALTDVAWQTAARHALPLASDRLASLLSRHDLAPAGGTALFQWVVTAKAGEWWLFLAEQGILVRHFPAWGALRFGLPGEEKAWQRLEQALKDR
ncbi:MAG: threonine-phosphate decarboxylase [Magnetococcales bacterium]|nr:threonine-phosphate decarboxylase [Magnetococcales bacterium]